MDLLGQIIYKPGLKLDGRAVLRQAVRAVIWQEGRLLLIHDAFHGGYKFPGGGVQAGETHFQALARELSEECGAQQVLIGPPLGKMVEIDRPIETDLDIFKMTSYYYHCRLDGPLGALSLDPYEEELGFEPVWMEPQAALRCDQTLLARPPAPRWLNREVVVLRKLTGV